MADRRRELLYDRRQDLRGLVTYYTMFVIHLASRRVRILGSTPFPNDLFMR